MPELSQAPSDRRWFHLWPWLLLVSLALPAIWHVVDFPDDIDSEYPNVQRPTFSRRPPPAYRLAEPGDTIDRVAIYVSAIGIVIAAAGLANSGGSRPLWLSAMSLGLAAFWHASTPGPTFDGWHGLGWRLILDPSGPPSLRFALALALVALAAISSIPIVRARDRWPELRLRGRQLGNDRLLIAAIVLVVLRQFELPGVEPAGYWPRWSFVWGLVAFDLALLRALPTSVTTSPVRRLEFGLAGVLVWFGLVSGGIALTWYHRPLARLREVEPGRIYISAMPTRRGLEVAQARHHFRTIINLFPENTPLRSPRLPDELAFAAKHGIRYIGSPSEDSGAGAFLDLTLNLARDPSAWPILVHCHGCMDRSPAWMGIYRFVVQGRSLSSILQEIERHRGYRPKASVSLLYSRVLPPRAPGRFASDPTAILLERCIGGGGDVAGADSRANSAPQPRVSRGKGTSPPRPNLTPGPRSLEYRKATRDPSRQEPATRS